jgi:hypothetical protein
MAKQYFKAIKLFLHCIFYYSYMHVHIAAFKRFIKMLLLQHLNGSMPFDSMRGILYHLVPCSIKFHEGALLSTYTKPKTLGKNGIPWIFPLQYKEQQR